MLIFKSMITQGINYITYKIYTNDIQKNYKYMINILYPKIFINNK